jgi:pilus assembly protein CpaB
MGGPMKKVRILALISAIITGVLLYRYLNTLSEPVVVEVIKRDVVVSTADIPANIPITADMIKITQVPEEAAHALSVKDVNEVVGKVSTSVIIQGEQVLSSKLVTPGQGNGTLTYKIEEGKRAITVGVNNRTGLSNMIIPDNKVDIIAEYTIEVEVPGTNDKKTIDYSAMLLENVRVLAVDNQMTEQDKAKSENAYVSLTLEVTPLEAMEVSLTEYKGTLRAVLRSPLDEGTTKLPSLTVDKVIFKNN